MMNVLNNYRLCLLLIVFLIGSSIILLPPLISSMAYHDSWLVGIISTLIGGILAVYYAYITASLRNNRAFERLYRNKFVLSIFFSYALILSGLVLKNIGDFLTSTILPETPIEFLHIYFFIAILFGVSLGVVVLGYSIELLFPFIIIIFVFLFAVLTPQVELPQFLPMLYEGINPIIKGLIPVIGTPFSELILFTFLYPYIEDTFSLKKAYLFSCLIGGIILTLITVYCIGILGAIGTANTLYPTFDIAKIIQIPFFERLEVIIATIWIITIFFKLSFTYFITCKLFSKLVNLTSYKYAILPLAFLVVPFSYIAYPDVAYTSFFVSEIWPYYSMTIGILLPAVLYLIASVGNKNVS